MKKIILLFAIVSLCLTGFAQSEEFIRVYSEWRLIEGDTFELEDSNFEITIITFNYNGKNIVEIKRQDTEPFYLYQVGEVEEDKDENGNLLQTMKTVGQDGEDVLFNFFEDDKKGVVLVFKNRGKVQMVNFCN